MQKKKIEIALIFLKISRNAKERKPRNSRKNIKILKNNEQQKIKH